MKYLLGLIACCLLILYSGCESKTKREERLAKLYCGNCHVFPDPSLLTKRAWETSVLPQMAFRMGFNNMDIATAISSEDFPIVARTRPSEPIVTEEEWNAIKNYFISNAPDSLSLPLPEVSIDTTLKQFDVSALTLPDIKFPLITLIKADTISKTIFIGTRSSMLFQFRSDFTLKKSFQLQSPPSSIMTERSKSPIISLMGIMDPNDQSKGELIKLDLDQDSVIQIIDSLKRPVCFKKADLNGDQLDDYIICAFGNYTGALLVYENLGNEKYKKHVVESLPGARRIIVRDLNGDGLKDILVLMTQGNEEINLLTNGGNFKFRITTLLQFPPVYGSSYFDIADFNHDGKFDILYTNGDNADYSAILKPYHGVRIFINNGKNNFSQSMFYYMNGAAKALTVDFDNDGDLDIAAISFFPNFKTHPANGFVYLENTGNNNFIPHETPKASMGRWLVMDVADYDSDGDSDILLGALDFNSAVPRSLLVKWSTLKTDVLVLRNNLRKQK